MNQNNTDHSNDRDILDDLSPTQLKKLEESFEQYRAGKVIKHEDILEWLRQWRSK